MNCSSLATRKREKEVNENGEILQGKVSEACNVYCKARHGESPHSERDNRVGNLVKAPFCCKGVKILSISVWKL